VADKSQQLIQSALTQAMSTPGGTPLFGTRTAPGLFANNAAGKTALERCRKEGWLRVFVSYEDTPAEKPSRRKTNANKEMGAITEEGLAYLLREVSPKQILEDLLRFLEARQAQSEEWSRLTRKMHEEIGELRGHVEKVLGHLQRTLPAGSTGPLSALFQQFVNQAPPRDATSPTVKQNGQHQERIAQLLQKWQGTSAWEDCPLPELYNGLRETSPSLTIGEFHDLLREMQEGGRIYLHPWTGPLYEIPEPRYALLIGHEIAYYTSLRVQEPARSLS
jgi:hypothetical protein